MCIYNFGRYGQSAIPRGCFNLHSPAHLLSASPLWVRLNIFCLLRTLYLYCDLWFSISLLLFLGFIGFIFILGKIALCYFLEIFFPIYCLLFKFIYDGFALLIFFPVIELTNLCWLFCILINICIFKKKKKRFLNYLIYNSSVIELFFSGINHNIKYFNFKQ